MRSVHTPLQRRLYLGAVLALVGTLACESPEPSDDAGMHAGMDAGMHEDAGGASDSGVSADAGPDHDGAASDAGPTSCAGWSSQDIGAVQIAGSWSCDPAAGTHAVSASGRDIWSTDDEFHFVYQALSGDGSITARVASFDAADPWAKAGVMIRESLEPDARHAHVLVSYSSDNPIKLDRRLTPGGDTSGASGADAGAPRWLRLLRRGDVFTGFESVDGDTWTEIGEYTVAMGADVYVGLSVTSNDEPTSVDAAFESVVIDRAPAPECSASAPCQAGETCEAGVCVSVTPGCGAGPACVAGERCEAGLCVGDGPFTGHEALLNGIVGYGRGVTGGAGGTLIEVTNTNNSGSGSLREALAVSGPTWIYFTPGLTGTIDATSLLYAGADTTIDGRGADVALGGFTLNVYGGSATGSDNVVIHNVSFTGNLPDRRTLLRLRYGSGFWLDHISFEAQSDDGKPLGFGDGVTDITVSWCDFSGSEAPLIWIISSDNESPGDAAIRATAHHNLFEGTDERHPRVRYATIHWLNNAVIDWLGYGSSISQEGFFFADHSVYMAGRNNGSAIITMIGNGTTTGDPLMGNLRTVGNWWANGTEVPAERNPSSVPVPPYPYTAETADAALVSRIRAGVGWQDVASPFL